MSKIESDFFMSSPSPIGPDRIQELVVIPGKNGEPELAKITHRSEFGTQVLTRDGRSEFLRADENPFSVK